MICIIVGFVLVGVAIQLQNKRADFQSPNTIFYSGIILLCVGFDSLINHFLLHA